ncbi:MAG: aldo/keto reductase [Bacteroidales bacterium]|nr:aldo/keto reductase [Bacteroidales bacterium]
MDRRDFIKTSGLAAAGLGMVACVPELGRQESAPDNEFRGEMAQNYPGTGLLGYGCMRWPVLADGSTIDQEKVNEMVDFALAHGVNYFDSAPVYLQGKSEAATAEALLRHPRESYVIATKCSNMRGQDGWEMYRKSLEIYRTDHLDYYLLHNLQGYESFKRRFLDTGLLDKFLREREAGRIRHLGLSFHGQKEGFDELLALHGTYHWDFFQIQMNYLDWTHPTRDVDARYMYGKLDEAGIPVVIMEPLLGGRLADIPAGIGARMKAREPRRSIASWAFRFCGSFPRVLTVLSGMTYMDHLQDNLHSFLEFKPLEEAEMAFLEDVAEEMARFPLVRCTGCQYCMPCPYGIDIPGIFRFYNTSINEDTYVRNPEQKGYAKLRRRFLAAYDKAVESVRQADHCIACGKCVNACPQHIPIPARLREIDTYIESVKRGE